MQRNRPQSVLELVQCIVTYKFVLSEVNRDTQVTRKHKTVRPSVCVFLSESENTVYYRVNEIIIYAHENISL